MNIKILSVNFLRNSALPYRRKSCFGKIETEIVIDRKLTVTDGTQHSRVMVASQPGDITSHLTQENKTQKLDYSKVQRLSFRERSRCPDVAAARDA